MKNGYLLEFWYCWLLQKSDVHKFDASGCSSYYITCFACFSENTSQVGGLPNLFNQQYIYIYLLNQKLPVHYLQLRAFTETARTSRRSKCYNLRQIIIPKPEFSDHSWMTTLWFWGFRGSLAPHLVGKYIIPGDPNRSPNITGFSMISGLQPPFYLEFPMVNGCFWFP